MGAMRFGLLLAFLLCAGCAANRMEEPHHLMTASNLPVALDRNFEFRKFKIFNLTDQGPGTRIPQGGTAQNLTTRSNFKSRATTQEASLNFERSYRYYGAVTGYDRRERQGEYFDFFWRTRRTSDVTVRFEYKQELLRAAAQAQEVQYPAARGTMHSAFRVVGDEFHDDGPVLAWRCLLVAHGRIVAEKRSFLWD